MVESSDVKRVAVSMAMELAAERGFGAVTLADVAVRANVPLAELYSVLPSRTAILDAFFADVDRFMLEGVAEFTPEDGVRDRLFALLMRRFDALTPYKRAMASLMREAGRDPLSAVGGLGRLARAMALTLEAAGVSSSGPFGNANAGGLAVAFAYAVRTWLEDDSPDMARTMAALDKALRRGESLTGFLRRGPWPRRGPTTRGGTTEETA